MFLPQNSHFIYPLLSFRRFDEHTRAAEYNEDPRDHQKVVWLVSWCAGYWTYIVLFCNIYCQICLKS